MRDRIATPQAACHRECPEEGLNTARNNGYLETVAHGKAKGQPRRKNLIEQSKFAGTEYGDVLLDDTHKERGPRATDESGDKGSPKPCQ